MPGVLYFDDIFQDATRYSTRTVVTTGSTAGTDDAAYPVANVFDKNVAKFYRRNSVTNAGIVKLDFTINTIEAFDHRAAALIVANCYALTSAGVSKPLQLLVQVDTTTFGSTNVGQGEGFIFQGGSYVPSRSGRNSAVIYRPVADELLVYGGTTTPQTASSHKVRLNITNNSGSTVDVYVGRCALMAAFVADVTPGLTYSPVDPSIVQRAFSGTPYRNKIQGRRRVTGTFQIRDAQAFTEAHPIAGSSMYNLLTYASVPAVNHYNGITDEVFFAPEIYEDLANYTNGVQHRSVFGLLQAPLETVLHERSGEAAGDWWHVPFEIEETVA